MTDEGKKNSAFGKDESGSVPAGGVVMTDEGKKRGVPERDVGNGNGTSGKDEKVERERLKKLKAERDAAAYKKKYFEFYDDVKHSYREDW